MSLRPRAAYGAVPGGLNCKSGRGLSPVFEGTRWSVITLRILGVAQQSGAGQAGLPAKRGGQYQSKCNTSRFRSQEGNLS